MDELVSFNHASNSQQCLVPLWAAFSCIQRLH